MLNQEKYVSELQQKNYEIEVFTIKTGYLNLKYPTWLPLLCRIMKTIMPLTQDNQKILVHALVRFGETRDEPNFEDPIFKVISHTFKVLAIIHPVDFVMGKIYSHLFIKGVHTT